jgi:hypothetical protein
MTQTGKHQSRPDRILSHDHSVLGRKLWKVVKITQMYERARIEIAKVATKHIQVRASAAGVYQRMHLHYAVTCCEFLDSVSQSRQDANVLNAELIDKSQKLECNVVGWFALRETR